MNSTVKNYCAVYWPLRLCNTQVKINASCFQSFIYSCTTLIQSLFTLENDVTCLTVCCRKPFKCHYDQNSYIHFLHFHTQYVCPKDIAKFQYSTIFRTQVFWTFIYKNLLLPLIFLVPSLGWEFE